MKPIPSAVICGPLSVSVSGLLVGRAPEPSGRCAVLRPAAFGLASEIIDSSTKEVIWVDWFSCAGSLAESQRHFSAFSAATALVVALAAAGGALLMAY